MVVASAARHIGCHDGGRTHKLAESDSTCSLDGPPQSCEVPGWVWQWLQQPDGGLGGGVIRWKFQDEVDGGTCQGGLWAGAHCGKAEGAGEEGCKGSDQVVQASASFDSLQNGPTPGVVPVWRTVLRQCSACVTLHLPFPCQAKRSSSRGRADTLGMGCSVT